MALYEKNYENGLEDGKKMCIKQLRVFRAIKNLKERELLLEAIKWLEMHREAKASVKLDKGEGETQI